MFMPEEYKNIRITRSNTLQQFPNKDVNQLRPTNNVGKYKQEYVEYLKGIIDEFVGYFSMHGLNRIFESNFNKFKRIIWTVGFSACLYIFLYISHQVAYRYHTTPLVTVVSFTHYPVFRIPFPEVTVCNNNHFNWKRLDLAKKVFLKTEHQQIPEYQNLFTEVVGVLDTLISREFDTLENISKVPSALLKELNYINFELVSEFMAWKCYEMFSICEWRNENYNCCDIFFLRNSKFGTCLAFNTIESAEGLEKQKNDSFWPWHTKGSGIYNGLRVRVHIREYNHSTRINNKKGVWVMLTEPKVWYTKPIQVNAHTRTSISIKPVIHTFSDYTRVIAPDERQCLFEDERDEKYYKSLPDRVYTYENCKSQCQQESVLKFCNCTMSLFFPPGPYKSCQLVDYPCLFYNKEKFRHFVESAKKEYVPENNAHIVKCSCFSNCKSITYAPTVTTAYMNHMEIDFNNSFVDLDVSFQTEFIMVYLTTLLFTWTDLMASFGGLAGLCIGCTLFSLVEIAYFFIIDLPYKSLLYYRMKNDIKLQKKSNKAKVGIMENI